MAKKDKDKTPEQKTQPTPEEVVQEQEQPVEAAPAEAVEEPSQYEKEHEAFLRLAAEYDNFRKRSLKEKEQSYRNGKADAVAKLLPVYDNLERALQQPTQDEAYKKGVEMTMNELVKIFTGLGVEIFGAVGEPFDPQLHNAILHTEDENLGENVIAQVLQKGFKLGERIVRFAMVQVAN